MGISAEFLMTSFNEKHEWEMEEIDKRTVYHSAQILHLSNISISRAAVCTELSQYFFSKFVEDVWMTGETIDDKCQ